MQSVRTTTNDPNHAELALHLRSAVNWLGLASLTRFRSEPFLLLPVQGSRGAGAREPSSARFAVWLSALQPRPAATDCRKQSTTRPCSRFKAAMLRGSCQPAALRSAARQATAHRMLVVCGSGGSSGGGGGEDPSRLTPSKLGAPLPSRLLGDRAFTVLSGARQLNLKQLGTQLGGTLIVDDASHKEEVKQARGGRGGGQGSRRPSARC